VIPPKQNADFVCDMEKVLEVYKRPYDSDFPVVCLDESPKQLIGEIREPIKTESGKTLYDSEYVRNGVAEIYMLFEPLAGWRHIEIKDTHTRLDWAEVVSNLIETKYKDAKKVTLVEDNLSAHKPSAMYELYEPERAKKILDKIEFVFTPKHGSWLDMAESELSVLTRQCIKGRIPDKEKLKKKIEAWEEIRNQKQVKTIWRFTTSDARIKLLKLYPTKYPIKQPLIKKIPNNKEAL